MHNIANVQSCNIAKCAKLEITYTVHRFRFGFITTVNIVIFTIEIYLSIIFITVLVMKIETHNIAI